MQNTVPDLKWRQRARQSLERYFRKRSAPRLILSLILVLTGAVGLAVSFLLLHGGMRAMWLRYPIAVLCGYIVFLLLLRFWVEFEKSRFNPQAGEIETGLENGQFDDPSSMSRDRGRSWWQWLDFPDAFDVEGCLSVLLIAVLLALFGLIVFAILSATALIGEVFLDAFIVSVLYRRLRIAARGHWLGTAVRKTWISAIATAVLLGVAGWCLETMAPGAHSIGPALDRLLTDHPQNAPEP
jgi:hypothetical protein